MQRADSFEKTLMLGKIEGRRRRGQQRMRWLDGIINLTDMNLSKLRKMAFLRLHPSTAFQTLLLTMMATPFLLRTGNKATPVAQVVPHA